VHDPLKQCVISAASDLEAPGIHPLEFGVILPACFRDLEVSAT
jgi:hypothetical protein